MSTPVDQQQQLQPPPQAYTTHGNHGSVGAFIAVLAVIIILGVIACMIGRLCSRRRILGFGEYDMEGWVERKCSSCIDGHVDPRPPRPADAPAEVEDAREEIKDEAQEKSHRKTEASTSQP